MNPLLPDAVRSAPTDASTVPAEVRTLIEGRTLRAFHAQPQFASYLDIPATGPVGTLDLAPGTHGYEELVADGPVLEIVSFSSNMPDSVSGDFAAEIKVGYLHTAGRKVPVAQGRVFGYLFAALGQCRMSQEVESLDGYRGPRFIRCEGLQVAGA